MPRKAFYTAPHKGIRLVDYKHKRELGEPPSRPPTALSLMAETMLSNKETDQLFTWAFGPNWRMNAHWDDLVLFIGIKQGYFHKILTHEEIISEEWNWTLNQVTPLQKDDLIRILNQIKDHFIQKAIHGSFKILIKHA